MKIENEFAREIFKDPQERITEKTCTHDCRESKKITKCSREKKSRNVRSRGKQKKNARQRKCLQSLQCFNFQSTKYKVQWRRSQCLIWIDTSSLLSPTLRRIKPGDVNRISNVDLIDEQGRVDFHRSSWPIESRGSFVIEGSRIGCHSSSELPAIPQIGFRFTGSSSDGWIAT